MIECIEILLWAIVIGCLVQRANLMQKETFYQKLSVWLLLIGACYHGVLPFYDGHPSDWAELILPLGLTMFLLRYVHRVEKFGRPHANGD